MLYFQFVQEKKKYFYKEVEQPSTIVEGTPEFNEWLTSNHLATCNDDDIDMLICLVYNGVPVLDNMGKGKPYPYLMEDVLNSVDDEIGQRLIYDEKDYKKGGVHWKMVKPEIVRLKKDSD